ncbi:hypothetical protein HMPREF1991_01792 [Hoylesella loescheii DSM 19665 = JCM 12249 = ATCC 15930]|uniref:Uncharacterized protein n=1 Tax=Hoylesella loescheii DSM 19665 = JCM 12249 = ATCC 15930 TaxID=1122985 RepID=A0A069QHL9_HOYLO|nr:hypothetical protein HMPREF1991_01792 [Hoylesella loescheii DSM 19665 = JCM 12249 = ATCC 15930]
MSTYQQPTLSTRSPMTLKQTSRHHHVKLPAFVANIEKTS